MVVGRSTLLFVCATASFAAAQPFLGTINGPTIDRWSYPFAAQPGSEPNVTVFAALQQAGFDDRDAMFYLAFDTGSLVPSGVGSDRYVVSSLRVTAWVSADNQFEYDPTFDSVTTSFEPSQAGYTPDLDAGKPVELFAAGYRYGWTALTYLENSPFSPFPSFPPREGVRSVFAAVYDDAGIATDIGRQVRQGFEALPMAIGRNEELTPGQTVPAGTPLVFEADTGRIADSVYLARGFDDGRVTFMISGLHAAAGGPGGGTGNPNYPAFFTKESAVAQAAGYIARLEFSVLVYPGADFNLDGGVDGSDVEAFFTAWEAADTIADFNIDGGVDGADVEAFFLAWEQG